MTEPRLSSPRPWLAASAWASSASSKPTRRSRPSTVGSTDAPTASSSPTDRAVASALLRRLDLALRTPDAVHVAMAQRVDAKLATFDAKLADAAGRTALAVLTD